MRPRGLTLIELLIALGILSLVLGLTFNGLVQTSNIQTDQETATSVQAKLRRTVEVMTQDLRGAVMGGVVNSPYPSGTGQISFALLSGSAGYPILSAGSNGLTLNSLETAVANLGIDTGDRLMLVNSEPGSATSGQAVITRVASTPTRSSNVWSVSYGSCSSASTLNPDIAYEVQLQGYRLDTTSKTLYVSTSAGEVPMAYNITGFTVDYVYRNVVSSAETTNPTGYNGGGLIAARFSSGGNTLVLQRVQITLSAAESSRGRSITRSYTGQIEMVSNNGDSRMINTSTSANAGVTAICN